MIRGFVNTLEFEIFFQNLVEKISFNSFVTKKLPFLKLKNSFDFSFNLLLKLKNGFSFKFKSLLKRKNTFSFSNNSFDSFGRYDPPCRGPCVPFLEIRTGSAVRGSLFLIRTNLAVRRSLFKFELNQPSMGPLIRF